MSSVDFFNPEMRVKRSGLPDLLRYDRTLGNGVVLGKGGEFIITYTYRGPDSQCFSDEEQDFLRVQISNLMKTLRKGWMLHSTTMRRESTEYTNDGAFPDSITAAIEKERRAQYQRESTHYENEYYLTFTYLPPFDVISKLNDFLIEHSEKQTSSIARTLKKTLAFFEQQISDYTVSFESSISAATGGKGVTPMKRLIVRDEIDPITHRPVCYDDHLSFLHECLTSEQQPIRMSKQILPVGVDFRIGSYPFYAGTSPRINNKFIRVVAIETPPDEGTYFNILGILNLLQVKFRWTSRWIARDPDAVKASVQKVRAKWRQNIRGIVADMTGKTTGRINQNAANMAADAEAVLDDLESGEVAYGMWTSTVILFDEDPAFLDESVRYLLTSIRTRGFSCRGEDVNSNEAFLGSLPGHGYENVRRQEIHSMNLADTLPLTSVWQGPTENPCSFYKKSYGVEKVPPLFTGAASGGTPFRFVLHNDDVGHTFVAGPPGAGKSTLLGLIAASHFRYPNAQFFGFEKGESMLALCLAAGGTHYNFFEESTVLDENKEVVPTDVITSLAPLSQIHKSNELAWACEYIETILMLNEVVVDIDMRSEIVRAMEALAKKPVHMRSLTHFIELVQINEVKKVIKTYEMQAAGGMLNGFQDSISASRFTVFEMEQLMNMSHLHSTPVLLYLFRMIERKLDGSPTIICLDEAWLLLKHEVFVEKMREWFKVLRKANALVIFATQELQDVASSPIASTIFDACQTKVLLPNSRAMSPVNMELYKAIGLSERMVYLLSQGKPKREYFFISPAGQRMFDLELGPVTLAFIGASGIDDRKMVKQMRYDYGDNWPVHWLRKKEIRPEDFLGQGAILSAEYNENRKSRKVANG